jgi:hypothetical protein
VRLGQNLLLWVSLFGWLVPSVRGGLCDLLGDGRLLPRHLCREQMRLRGCWGNMRGGHRLLCRALHGRRLHLSWQRESLRQLRRLLWRVRLQRGDMPAEGLRDRAGRLHGRCRLLSRHMCRRNLLLAERLFVL